MPPPADIVKVAIEWPGANAQLIEMDQVCIYVKHDIKYIPICLQWLNFYSPLVAKTLLKAEITDCLNLFWM